MSFIFCIIEQIWKKGFKTCFSYSKSINFMEKLQESKLIKILFFLCTFNASVVLYFYAKFVNRQKKSSLYSTPPPPPRNLQSDLVAALEMAVLKGSRD